MPKHVFTTKADIPELVKRLEDIIHGGAEDIWFVGNYHIGLTMCYEGAGHAGKPLEFRGVALGFVMENLRRRDNLSARYQCLVNGIPTLMDGDRAEYIENLRIEVATYARDRKLAALLQVISE